MKKSLMVVALLSLWGCAALEAKGIKLPSFAGVGGSGTKSSDGAMPSLTKVSAVNRPAYCSKSKGSRTAPVLDKVALGQGFTAAAILTCREEQDAMTRQVDDWKAHYLAHTGANQADIDASLAARVDSDALDAEEEAECRAAEPRKVAFGNLETRLRGELVQWLLNCPLQEVKAPTSAQDDFDRSDATMVERLARIDWYIGDDMVNGVVENDNHVQPSRTAYAAAGMDLVALDRAQLEKDLEKLKLPKAAAQIAREKFVRAQYLATLWKHYLVTQKQESPQFVKVTVDAAVKASNAWKAADKSDRDLQALLHRCQDLAIGKTKDNRKLKECSEDLRGRFQAMVDRGHLQGLEDHARLLASMPYAYETLEQLANVHEALGEKDIANGLRQTWLVGSRVVRGPHAWTYWAMVDANAELGDDGVVSFASRPPASSWARDREWSFDSDDDRGRVVSVSAEGDMLKLTFANEKIDVADVDCVETNKIDRIENGKVTYRQSCRIIGSHEETVHIDPVKLPKRYSAGVSTGRFLSFRRYKGNTGFPIAEWESSKEKKLQHLAGFVAR